MVGNEKGPHEAALSGDPVARTARSIAVEVHPEVHHEPEATTVDRVTLLGDMLVIM